MDLNLPNVSGLEACRRILRTNPRAKVILITGMIDETMRAEALAAGATAFVPKLAAGDELILAIRRAWADVS